MSGTLRLFCCWVAVLAAGACSRGQEPAAPAAAGASRPASAPSPAPAAPAQAAKVTAAVPQLEVETLDHGRYVLAERRGRWVVVNFWATWCAPCIKEMPELSELDSANEHIEVIGLAYEEMEKAAMRDFLTARPVAYPIALVDMYAPPADFATPRGLPMTYLIAPDGTVAKQFLGPVTAVQITAVITAAGSGSQRGG